MRNRKLTYKEAALILLGLIVFVVLVSFLHDRYPQIDEFSKAHPFLAKFVFIILMLVVLAPFALVISFFGDRCPKCKTKYKDFMINYDTGTVKCVQCGGEQELTQVFDSEELPSLLEAALRSEGITSEEKQKIKELISKYTSDT
ncbi:MAG: hypothetical protein ACYS19_13960 [Planctomycetota bacterium]|jgi:hypothetical protein